MTRLRLGVLVALAVAFGAFSLSLEAMAAAEVHRLNLVVSAMPSQLDGGGINSLLDQYNLYPLRAGGFEQIDKIKMGWMFDSELRYFVRPNFAVAAGVGQLKVQTKREFLPSIGASINLRAEVLTVPVHVGAQYYLMPYTQGDFQARAFVGAGLMSLTATRAQFSTVELGLPHRGGDTLDVASLGGTNQIVAKGDAPGFYAEAGAHLFFAARYSVIVGVVYRSMKLRDLDDAGHIFVPDGPPLARDHVLATEKLGKDGRGIRLPDLDLSGVGVRMALGIGF